MVPPAGTMARNGRRQSWCSGVVVLVVAAAAGCEATRCFDFSRRERSSLACFDRDRFFSNSRNITRFSVASQPEPADNNLTSKDYHANPRLSLTAPVQSRGRGFWFDWRLRFVQLRGGGERRYQRRQAGEETGGRRIEHKNTLAKEP